MSVEYALGTLETRAYGTGGTPILLLHGWGGNADSLAGMGKSLAQQRRVISLSLPGFGASPEPDSPWGSHEYAELVLKWLAESGISKVDLIAHSFGGRVALCLAADHPELIGRMVLMGSAGLRAPRSLWVSLRIARAKLLGRMANVIGGDFAARLRKRRESLGSSDWRAASPMMRRVLSRVLAEDLADECGRITAPTLLIWGSVDTAAPLTLGQRMHRLIQGSVLTVHNGAGHYIFLDKSGEVLSAVWKHFGLKSAW